MNDCRKFFSGIGLLSYCFELFFEILRNIKNPFSNRYLGLNEVSAKQRYKSIILSNPNNLLGPCLFLLTISKTIVLILLGNTLAQFNPKLNFINNMENTGALYIQQRHTSLDL